MSFEILRGDCLAVLKTLPDSSFDSIVTDPPYELGFMGKAWDASGIAYSIEMWREALRVLKPGGHLLAFSGSRTYHRMTCAIEDAGFEIRDQIMWVYGSGFPKSLNVSKAIESGGGRPEDIRRMQMGAEYEASGRGRVNYDHGAASAMDGKPAAWSPSTDSARQWEGWGTALKPAHEPICVARKPLIGTVAANVLQFGTGALNIDGCRVGDEDMSAQWDRTWNDNNGEMGGRYGQGSRESGKVVPPGRWPANLIHDGSEEVLAAFPDAKGQQGATAARSQGDVYGTVNAGQIGVRPRNDAGTWRCPDCGNGADFDHRGCEIPAGPASTARFFYCAKASKSDRGPGNTHPTVKPLALMRYLLRLVTPPGGRSLDIFAGSGSTIVAGLQEGFTMTGIELTPEYADIAERRAQEEYLGDLI